MQSDSKHQWPTLPISVTGLILTAFSVVLLLDLRIEADVYGLLAFFMMIPVGLGIAWGLAAYSLLRTELTLLAATVPTLLIGIGIDHCIHMIQSCRYAMTHDRTLAALDTWISSEGLGSWSISGAPALNSRIDALLKRDVATVLPIAALAILLVLIVGTRSLLLPCIILAPLLLSLVWLAGLMSFFGIAVSAVTIAIAPLVLGIGVDGGVHFVASWRRHEGQLEEVFAETGLAIIVTVTTSVAAFGTFIVADSPSLIRFGSQASLALIGCLIITLTVLPTIVRRFLPAKSITTERAPG